MNKIQWGKPVEKQLKRLPLFIITKFQVWVSLVQESGIREIRKIKSFHDEPLLGLRKGQRSIEVNKHEY